MQPNTSVRAMADLLSLGADIDWPDHEAPPWSASTSPARPATAGSPNSPSGSRRCARRASPSDGSAARLRPAGPPRRRRRGRRRARRGRHRRTPTSAPRSPPGSTSSTPRSTRVPTCCCSPMPGLRADIAIAASVLTNTEPVKVLTRGASATAPESWMDLAVEVRDTRRRCLAVRDQPDVLLDDDRQRAAGRRRGDLHARCRAAHAARGRRARPPPSARSSRTRPRRAPCAGGARPTSAPIPCTNSR